MTNVLLNAILLSFRWRQQQEGDRKCINSQKRECECHTIISGKLSLSFLVLH